MVAREYFIAMMEMDGHLQAFTIEERKVAVEPIEDLEEVLLDDHVLGWTTRIGTQVDPSIHKKLALF